MARGSAERPADVAPEAARALSPWIRRALIAAAVLLAAANLIFGLLFRRDDESAADFMLLLQWSGEWLRGSDPYARPHSLVDYPPTALVTLAPLAALALPQAIAIWTGLHVALTAAMGALALRLAPLGRDAFLFGALVVALAPFRTVLQFSLASFVPAIAGVVLADRHPRLAGVAIGISLFKPHIGGPALLWAMAARRWQVVRAALAVPAALFVVYLARARRGPLETIADWLQALVRTQNRGDLVAGETGLRQLFEWGPVPRTGAQAIVAVVLGLGLVVIWRRRGRDFDLRFFAAACLLSLLAFRHLSYNLLLVIPALAFALTRAGAAGRAIAAVSFAVLIASPPSVWRLVIEPSLGETFVDPLAMHAYRLVCAALFLLVVLARERAPRGDTI
jgi:hypothetical protein